MQRHTKIAATFASLRNRQQKALITYLMAGDPDLSTTKSLILTLEQNGADIIELGIPYSDPLADGPVIQQASLRALQQHIRIDDIFAMIREVRTQTVIPLVIMTYFNCILQYGIDAFLSHCSTVGIDGLIVPDLPLEEGVELRNCAQRYGVDIILLVTPTTPAQRCRDISAASNGFIYCVAIAGVTGSAAAPDGELSRVVTEVRQHSDLPLAVGFGISNPQQAATVAQQADGVIIGSAIVRLVGQYGSDPNAVNREVGSFARQLKQAIS